MARLLTAQEREVIIQDLDELRRMVTDAKRYFGKHPGLINTAVVKDQSLGSPYWLVKTRAEELNLGPVTEVLSVVVTVASLIIEEYEEMLRQDELAMIQRRIQGRWM